MCVLGVCERFHTGVLFDYCFIIYTVICQEQHLDPPITSIQIQWELKDFIILNAIEEPQ